MKYTLIMLLASSLPAMSMDQDDLEKQRTRYADLQQQTLRKMGEEFERALRESLQTSSSQPSQRQIPQTHTPHPSFAEAEDDPILQAALRESLQMSHQQPSQTSTLEEDALLAERLQEEENASHSSRTTTTHTLYSPLDPASERLIRQLQAEDSSIDPVSADLVQQMQAMDLRENRTPHHYDRSVRARFASIAPTAAQVDFNKIKRDLLAIYGQQGIDVHRGDQFISQNARNLSDIAALFDAHLSPESRDIHQKNLLQLQDHLLALIAPYQDVLEGYAYQDINNNNIHKNYTEITQIIRNQFARSNREIGSYAEGQGTIIWARFLALAAERLNDPYTSEEIKQTIARILAEKAIEGMLTQGGCIQGFVNRGFIGLMTILGWDLSDNSEARQFQSY
ncbi:MAG: hypothetical protein K0M45_02590 [Candidatus Paracaedibacteraceae bacterium]|nr:hypothetical protein [Candidatus Paracaedibacteraceae bacterium]